MHIADIDGKIYERIKYERKRQVVFALWFSAFMVVTVLLLVFCGGVQ